MAEHTPAAGGMRVLLVHGDPEPELTRALAREGHDVLPVAEDGRPARFLRGCRQARGRARRRPGTAELLPPDSSRRQAPGVSDRRISSPSRNLVRNQSSPTLQTPEPTHCLGPSVSIVAAADLPALIAARRRGLRTAAASASAAATTRGRCGVIKRRQSAWSLYALALAAAAVAALAITELDRQATQRVPRSRSSPLQTGVVQSTVSGSGNVQAGADLNANFQTSGTLTGRLRLGRPACHEGPAAGHA